MLLDPHLVPSCISTQQDVWLSPSSLVSLSAQKTVEFRILFQELRMEIIPGSSELYLNEE